MNQARVIIAGFFVAAILAWALISAGAGIFVAIVALVVILVGQGNVVPNLRSVWAALSPFPPRSSRGKPPSPPDQEPPAPAPEPPETPQT